MNKKHIEKKYAELLHDVKTNDFYKVDLSKPRVNCYKCERCGHITKTRDVDAGVTPFYYRCEACGGMGASTMFRDISPNQEPTFEWYRPTLEQVLKMDNVNLIDHILNGGLDVRPIAKPNPHTSTFCVAEYSRPADDVHRILKGYGYTESAPGIWRMDGCAFSTVEAFNKLVDLVLNRAFDCAIRIDETNSGNSKRFGPPMQDF